MLLFFPLFSAVHPVALLLGVTAGILLPVGMMPLCYDFINGSTFIGVGRYHLPMAASGLLGALTLVLSLGTGSHPVSQAFALFGITFLGSLSAQVYAYVHNAVGLRFDQSGMALRLKSMFALCAGVLVAIGCAIVWDGSYDAVRTVVAICAVLALAGMATAYFATARAMPSFIRLEPRHKRRVREVYARFFAPLRVRAVRLLSTATLLLFAAAAFAAAALPTFVFSHRFGLKRGFKPAVLILSTLVWLTGIAVHAMQGKRKSGGVTAAAFAATAVAAAVCAAVVLVLGLPTVYTAIVLYTLLALVGVALGMGLSTQSRSEPYAARLADCTPGRYACLRNCIATAGIAVGSALACATFLLAKNASGKTAAVVCCAVLGALLLAAALVGFAAQADRLWSAPVGDARVRTEKETAKLRSAENEGAEQIDATQSEVSARENGDAEQNGTVIQARDGATEESGA